MSEGFVDVVERLWQQLLTGVTTCRERAPAAVAVIVAGILVDDPINSGEPVIT